jgi:hypothetical protein
MPYNVPKIGSLTDFTSVVDNAIIKIPARYSIMSDLGLVKPEYHNTNTFILTRLEYKDGKLTPVQWGTAVKNDHTNTKSYLTLQIPHYAQENAILPQDADSKFSWDQVVAADRIQGVQELYEQKMGQAKQAMVNAWNSAFLQVMRDGTAAKDASGGTTNYYTEMAITQKTVTMTLSDDTIDPMAKIYEAIDHIKDVYRGGTIPSRFICLAERTLFDALERHPYTVDSYKYFAQVQSTAILNQGLGTGGLGLNAYYKTLEFGGVTFIRVDTNEMTLGEGRLFPVDIPDLFEVHFAPAKDHFSTVNTVAESMYYWEDVVPDKRIGMTVETNFLAVLKWPEVVVKVVKA